MASDRNGGIQRSDAAELGDPLQRRRAHQRDVEAAVGGEALLRREVVGVGLADVDGQAARAGGRVDQDQLAVDRARRAGRPARRRRWTSRCAPRRARRATGRPAGSGALPGSALTTTGSARNGAPFVDSANFGGELAVGQVQRALADQAERGRRPRTPWTRRCRARPRSPRGARTARAGPPARRRPAPSPASAGARCPSEAPEAASVASCSGRTLDGSAAEAAVGGLEVGGDREIGGRGSCHRFSLPPAVWGSLGRAGELDGRAARRGRACQDVRDGQHGGVCDDGYAGPARRARAPRGRADLEARPVPGRRVGARSAAGAGSSAEGSRRSRLRTTPGTTIRAATRTRSRSPRLVRASARRRAAGSGYGLAGGRTTADGRLGRAGLRRVGHRRRGAHASRRRRIGCKRVEPSRGERRWPGARRAERPGAAAGAAARVHRTPRPGAAGAAALLARRPGAAGRARRTGAAGSGSGASGAGGSDAGTPGVGGSRADAPGVGAPGVEAKVPAARASTGLGSAGRRRRTAPPRRARAGRAWRRPSRARRDRRAGRADCRR